MKTLVRISRSIFFVSLIAFLTTSCTRESASSSKISMKLPELSADFKLTTMDASSGGSSESWGLTDPSSLSEINCYAVFVSAPEPAMQANTCKNSAGTVVAKPGIAYGFFVAGKTIEIDIPSGSSRTMQLVGLKTASSAVCGSIDTKIDKTQMAHPYIIGSHTMDLIPGKPETVNINMTLSTDAKYQIDDCEGPTFNREGSGGSTSPGSGSLAVTSIVPNIGSPVGGTMVSVYGSGFAAGMNIGIGGSACTNITVIDANQATCITGAHAAMAGNTVTVNVGNMSANLPAGFNYAVQALSVLKVSAGVGGVCALIQGGRIKCWGYNSYGEVGASASGSFGDDPSETGNGLPFVPLSALSLSAINVSSSASASCGIFSNGTMRCWGSNNQGLLGTGSASPSTIGWVSDPLLANWAAVNLSASGSTPKESGSGAAHTCALMSNGTVWCWGGNSYGQLGNGSNTASLIPVQVTGITTGVQLAVGDSHNCVRLVDGSVKCWGKNLYGGLGDGTTTDRNSPVAVSSLSGATDITVSQSYGGGYSCAVISAGNIKCWGYNTNGNLGDGTVTSSTVPVSAVGITGMLMVRAGNGHTCGLKNTGNVYCWGSSSAGQTGLDSSTGVNVPTQVLNVSGVVGISTGDVYTCAVFANGRVKCWGMGTYGALLQGNTNNMGDNAGEMASLPFIDLGSE